jgi:hypothetical protein
VPMAPVLLLTAADIERSVALTFVGESAWETQASWRQGHFGPKSAPLHRDFGPGKVGVN